MKQKQINSQISNWNTYLMYLRQLLTLAENVFEFKNMSDFIDIAYLNKNLVRKGAIAFFEDEVLGLLALPFVNVGTLDVYGRPKKIQVIAMNGYTRILEQDEFEIMYDNNGRYPIYLDICQYAERLALETRTIDINIAQQKTPRIWKTSTEHELSLRNILNNVDGFDTSVMTYDDINIDDTEAVLAPAPYVADKVYMQKEKDWAEFLRLIGVSNLTTQKKERVITDEIQAMQGGTIASRYSRFQPRQNAIEKINKKFNTNIEVKFYDGIPTTEQEKIENNEGEFEYDI